MTRKSRKRRKLSAGFSLGCAHQRSSSWIAREYLPNVVISTLKSIVAESDNRQNRMMFKLAVEIAIMQNLVALQQDIDPLSLERLRGDCVKEVKRLNGSFSFENALDWQKD